MKWKHKCQFTSTVKRNDTSESKQCVTEGKVYFPEGRQLIKNKMLFAGLMIFQLTKIPRAIQTCQTHD